MRAIPLAAVSLLTTLVASPAAAQISGRIHIDIPIGRPGAVAYRPPPAPRNIVVVDYSARDFGPWQRHYRSWEPITLYLADGRYYERPWRGARPVVVYRYRDRYFFAPRDRDWDRDHGRGWNNRGGRDDDRWDNDRRGDDRRDNDRRGDDRRDGRRDDRRDDARYDGRARPRG